MHLVEMIEMPKKRGPYYQKNNSNNFKEKLNKEKKKAEKVSSKFCHGLVKKKYLKRKRGEGDNILQVVLTNILFSFLSILSFGLPQS